MQVTSHKKSFPILGAFTMLVSLALIIAGFVRYGGMDRVAPCLNIVAGICLFVSSLGNIMNEVVQICIDDEVIQFRRRKSPGLVVSRTNIIWSDVRPNRIRFWYKGPLDVQGASIPLKRFGEKDADMLRMVFTENKDAQQAGGCDGEKPRS